MHALPVLTRRLGKQLPLMHALRRRALLEAVQAAAQGTALSLTHLARRLPNTAFLKHRIKRVDRLLGNGRLWAERIQIYQAMAHWMLCGCHQPLILIDWSELPSGYQLLRAAVPADGRSLVLYEEVHPRRLLGNRKVQHAFLDTLKALLPLDCQPIICADAGFKTPFYEYVEGLGWTWVGRLRGAVRVRRGGQWIPAKGLYPLANTNLTLVRDLT